MPENHENAWRCSICGFLHYGARPPSNCPICEAKAEDFKPMDIATRPERRAMGDERFVIVGAGVAGVSAAEAIREHAPRARVVLLSKENEPPYYRINLTRMLAGEFAEKNLPLRPEAWYAEHRIDLRLGVAAERVSLRDKTIRLDDGSLLPFDRLILATGAEPFIPPIPGADLDHTHTVRDANDARAIIARTRPGASIVCVGGGILGLETAGALAKQGANVTVLEAFEHLMPAQLNRAGSDALAAHLETLGVKILTNAIATEITADLVRLKRGVEVPAEIVILATGDRARVQLLEEAGLTVKKGVLVDNFLRTTNPDVFAVGDVAEHDGVRYGAWNPAMYMGKIAGMNAAGVPTEFGGIPRSHLLKVVGKPMFSIGVVRQIDGSYRAFEDHPEGGYRLFMTRDGRVVGCLLIGKLKLMKAARKAVQGRFDLGETLTPTTSAEEIATRLLEA